MINNSKIKAVTAIIVLVALLSSSGCWSRREMDTIAYILILAIDTTPEGKIKLFAQIGLPSNEPAGGGGEGPVSKVVTAEGENVTQAMDNLFLETTKRPSLNHLRLLVFSEKLAKSGLERVIDFLRRDIGVRLNIRAAVTSANLEELLKLEDPLSIQPALAIDNHFDANLQRSAVVQSQLMQLTRQLLEPDREVAMPIVEVSEDRFSIGKTAVFKGDKMVAALTREQTLGLLMWRDQVTRGVITVTQGETENAYSFRIVSSSTVIKTRWDGDKLHVKVTADTVVDISELQENSGNLEGLASNYLLNRLRGVLEVAKKEETDFLNLAVNFRRGYPKIWVEVKDRWADVLREAEYDLQSRVHIRGQGQIR